VGCSLAILNGQPRNVLLLACAYFPAFKEIKFKQIFAAGKAFGRSRDFWCQYTDHYRLGAGPLMAGI
jgi:hypothetical protein